MIISDFSASAPNCERGIFCLEPYRFIPANNYEYDGI